MQCCGTRSLAGAATYCAADETPHGQCHDNNDAIPTPVSINDPIFGIEHIAALFRVSLYTARAYPRHAPCATGAPGQERRGGTSPAGSPCQLIQAARLAGRAGSLMSTRA